MSIAKNTLWQLGISAITCSLTMSIAVAQNNDGTLQKGSFVIRPARVVHVPEDKVVRLTEDTRLVLDQLSLDGSIVTMGHLLQLDAGIVRWGPKGKIIAFDEAPPKVPTPSPANDGANGVDADLNFSANRNGQQGNPGKMGNPGRDGDPTPQPIIYVAKQTIGSLAIDARGQHGGPGGQGGLGGNGGSGGRGASARASCGTASSSCLSWNSGSGNGGAPANGGPGGRGGPGGNGGSAVPLLIAAADASKRDANDTVTVGPGDPGDKGAPGSAGRPGNPGPGGFPAGCCADVSLFGLICCSGDGAPGGPGVSFSAPGDFGYGDPGNSGADADLQNTIVSEFSQFPSISSKQGVAEGRAIDLGSLSAHHDDTISALYEFHLTRTYTYLFARSLALLGYNIQSAPSTIHLARNQGYDPDLATIIATSWDGAFIAPLKSAIAIGQVDNKERAAFWLDRGTTTVNLLKSLAREGMTGSANELYQSSIALTVQRVNSAIAACKTFADELQRYTSKIILLSYQLAIPSCTDIGNLTKADLYLKPLSVSEPIPELPSAFKDLIVDEPISLAYRANNNSKFASLTNALNRVAELFVSAANAQSVTVHAIPSVKSPKAAIAAIAFNKNSANGKKFFLQRIKTEIPNHSIASLGVDLRLFAEMVR